jgi:hypothetical protein
MSTYRLRVEVPLRPVASLRVADAIATTGGSIVSVALREVDGPSAVDELVVQVPPHVTRDELCTALDATPDAMLLSSQPCSPERSVDQAHEWVRANPEPAADGPLAALPERLAAACPFSRAWIGDTDVARRVPAASMALERGGPVAHRSRALPDPTLGSRRSPVWLLAVADDYPEAQRIALLTRPTALRFSATEVARVEVLVQG